MTDDGADFVFLLCSERSGSNLITKLLDSHPDVCGPSPSHLIRAFAPNLWRYGDLSGDAWRLLCEDVSDYLAAGLGVWRTTWTAATLAGAVERPLLSDLIAAVYRREAGAHGKRVIMVKENQCADLLAFLTTWFPSARYLFFVRDPRDMALSLKLSPATHGTVRRAAELWQRDQRSNLEARAILQGRIHTTRYEDLLSDATGELTAICEFLGLTFSGRMLRFNENELTQSNAARIDAWRNLAKPLMHANTGKYRDGLTDIETRYVEAVCDVEMSILGYEPDHATGGETLDSLSARLADHERTDSPSAASALSDEERLVRSARLAVIDRVLSRADG